MAQYNKNDTADWLKGESTSPNKKLEIDNSSNIKIEPTIIKTMESKKQDIKKRVTFDVEETDSFLSGLKIKTQNKELI